MKLVQLSYKLLNCRWKVYVCRKPISSFCINKQHQNAVLVHRLKSVKAQQSHLIGEKRFLQEKKEIYNLSVKYFSASSPQAENEGKLLYAGKSHKDLRFTLGGFYFLSFAAALVSPYMLKIASSHGTFPLVAASLHLFIFAIVNPLGLYLFGKRYVNKLYHNQKNDTYTAHILSPALFRDERLVFTPKDCKMPAKPSVFTSFFAKGRPLFINSNAMDYDDYVEMLRYAADLDYENPERQEEYRQSIESAVKQKQKEQGDEIDKK